MKRLLLLLILSVTAAYSAQAQSAPTAAKPAAPASTDAPGVVEASCGQCRLGLPGKGCDLAVRIDGRAYFVDGTSIDEHGDAHAADGFCQAIRQAQVRGAVVDGRFKATYFRLVPESAGTK
ncbi:DUF6370 family protein [Hymenobacter lucidus]|uniref:Glutaminyl-tRNA synthetase n=1 Tax=Hymenobacter lucidus TaxID=2880930 RepID=A0ABS8AUQ6_9BACT|nr:DUF6370 family protein [Hymenobacter lucidus]MCB2409096.1 hypothetical protein [Hymenobacter lucidus]